MKLQLILTSALTALLAMPAAALSPAPDCFAETGPEAQIGSYWPSQLGNGFVYYSAPELSTGGWVDILEYCPDRRQLVLRTLLDESEDARDQAALSYLEEMIHGEVGYTQSQMAERLRDLGADVEIRLVTYESCGCSLQ